MKKYLTTLLLGISISANAQVFVAAENDTTVQTEYNDGRLWAYRQIGDFVVGMTNYVVKSDYGKNYQILIFIKNLSETSALFDPSLVTSTLTDKRGETERMKVFTYEQYMKKVKNQQAWAMALTGFSTGLNAGMAGYQTTYTTIYGAGGMPYTQVHTTYNYAAASAANMAASTQLMTLSKLMSDDKKTISQGYLKLTTIHPNEGIIGYMNIKHRKGVRLTVNIPIEGHVFSFDWDVTKKKGKK
jgi:hypothetical protein